MVHVCPQLQLGVLPYQKKTDNIKILFAPQWIDPRWTNKKGVMTPGENSTENMINDNHLLGGYVNKKETRGDNVFLPFHFIVCAYHCYYYYCGVCKK